MNRACPTPLHFVDATLWTTARAGMRPASEVARVTTDAPPP